MKTLTPLQILRSFHSLQDDIYIPAIFVKEDVRKIERDFKGNLNTFRNDLHKILVHPAVVRQFRMKGYPQHIVLSYGDDSPVV